MPDVLAIPGIETVHPRSSWVDPAYPITGPYVDWTRITDAPIHYTAADNLIDGDPGEHADDLPAYFRSMNKAYWTSPSRGYALGYWWGVDWLGGVWQIRGWEFRSAANIGAKWCKTHGFASPPCSINPWTAPILCLVDGDDHLTDEAAWSVGCLLGEIQRRAGRPIHVGPHDEYEWTGCPGDGIRADIVDGRVRVITDPYPTIPPTAGGPPVMYQFRYRPAGAPGEVVMRVTADAVIHAQNGNGLALDGKAGVPTVQGTRDDMVNLLSDRGRRHESMTETGQNVGNPFDDPGAPEYRDPQLADLWRKYQR